MGGNTNRSSLCVPCQELGQFTIKIFFGDGLQGILGGRGDGALLSERIAAVGGIAQDLFCLCFLHA
jgi:hypothetical protein